MLNFVIFIRFEMKRQFHEICCEIFQDSSVSFFWGGFSNIYQHVCSTSLFFLYFIRFEMKRQFPSWQCVDCLFRQKSLLGHHLKVKPAMIVDLAEIRAKKYLSVDVHGATQLLTSSWTNYEDVESRTSPVRHRSKGEIG